MLGRRAASSIIRTQRGGEPGDRSRLRALRGAHVRLLRHAHRLGGWDRGGPPPGPRRRRDGIVRRRAARRVRGRRGARRGGPVPPLPRHPRPRCPRGRHPLRRRARRGDRRGLRRFGRRRGRHSRIRQRPWRGCTSASGSGSSPTATTTCSPVPRSGSTRRSTGSSPRSRPGRYKPDERPFQLAFERIGLPRDRILHVAQSLFHDHVTAKRLGLTTVWIDRRGGRAGGATPPAAAMPDATFPDMASFAEAATRR